MVIASPGVVHFKQDYDRFCHTSKKKYTKSLFSIIVLFTALKVKGLKQIKTGHTNLLKLWYAQPNGMF